MGERLAEAQLRSTKLQRLTALGWALSFLRAPRHAGLRAILRVSRNFRRVLHPRRSSSIVLCKVRLFPIAPVPKMLIDQIRANKSAIDRLGVKYGARRIRVFGSVARGAERPDSDVDFLVDFDRGYDLFAQRLPLARQLESLLGRPVEVIPEHELNRHIRDRVLSEAVEL